MAVSSGNHDRRRGLPGGLGGRRHRRQSRSARQLQALLRRRERGALGQRRQRQHGDRRGRLPGARFGSVLRQGARGQRTVSGDRYGFARRRASSRAHGNRRQQRACHRGQHRELHCRRQLCADVRRDRQRLRHPGLGPELPAGVAPHVGDHRRQRKDGHAGSLAPGRHGGRTQRRDHGHRGPRCGLPPRQPGRGEHDRTRQRRRAGHVGRRHQRTDGGKHEYHPGSPRRRRRLDRAQEHDVGNRRPLGDVPIRRRLGSQEVAVSCGNVARRRSVPAGLGGRRRRRHPGAARQLQAVRQGRNGGAFRQ